MFVAKYDIPAGANPIPVMLEEHLRKAEALIALCSALSHTSPWLWWESATVWANDGLVIPLFFDIGANDFPGPLTILRQGRSITDERDLFAVVEAVARKFQPNDDVRALSNDEKSALAKALETTRRARKQGNQFSISNAESVADLVTSLGKKGDSIQMCAVEQALRTSYPETVLRWRTKYDVSIEQPPDTRPIFDELVGQVLGRMVFALANVWTSHPSFEDQHRLVSDLLSIPEWKEGGLGYLALAPRSLVYVFHYLHGALCVELGRHNLALNVATLAVPNHKGPKPLWRHFDLTSSPHVFMTDARKAWSYLRELWTNHPVLQQFFASQNSFEISLTAYSIVLTLLEFTTDIRSFADGISDKIAGNKYWLNGTPLEVYPLFVEMPTNVIADAANLTIGNRTVVDLVLERSGAKRGEAQLVWPQVRALLERIANSPRNDDGIKLPLGNLA